MFWTNIPLAHQVKLFRKQLAYAALTDKPVVLHTKGCEREILTFIKEYPNRYLVHWYSSLELQKEYIEAGCYFTIGVDLKINQAMQQLAKESLQSSISRNRRIRGQLNGH